MKTLEQQKKERETARLALEALSEISAMVQAGARIDFRQTEALLDFYDGFFSPQDAVGEFDRKSSLGSEGEIIADRSQGKRLVKEIRTTLRQYQKGADRAEEEFARKAEMFRIFFQGFLAVDPLYRNLKEQDSKAGENINLFLKGVKGMYLID